MGIGRNASEVLRLVQAVQHMDKHGEVIIIIIILIIIIIIIIMIIIMIIIIGVPRLLEARG